MCQTVQAVDHRAQSRGGNVADGPSDGPPGAVGRGKRDKLSNEWSPKPSFQGSKTPHFDPEVPQTVLPGIRNTVFQSRGARNHSSGAVEGGWGDDYYIRWGGNTGKMIIFA